MGPIEELPVTFIALIVIGVILAANLALALAVWRHVRATREMAQVTRRMAQVMWEDYSARHAPVLSIGHHITHGSRSRLAEYTVTAAVVNRGLASVKVDEAVLRVGPVEKDRQRECLMAPGERLSLFATLNVLEIGREMLAGVPAQGTVRVVYRGLQDERLVKTVVVFDPRRHLPLAREVPAGPRAPDETADALAPNPSPS